MHAYEPRQIERPYGIGGSDVAALLGLSPYKSPVQLWAEKVGRKGFGQDQGLHLRFGQHLEPFVASEYERVTGLVAQVHPEPIFHNEHHFFFAHVDRLVQTQANCKNRVGAATLADTVLECKTASAFTKDDWGEANTDQVPTHYMLQCVWYMALTNCDRADLAVLIGNQEFRIYRIYRNAQLESLVLEQAKRFWDICVIGGEPPNTKSTQDANIIHPFSKKGAKVVASPEIAEVVDQIKIRQREIKKLDLEMESLKAQVMSTMAEGEELTLEDKVIVTWKSTKPAKRLDAQSLKLAHPDIAQAFTVIGAESRRFVIKDTE